MEDATAVAEVLEGAADALFVYGRCQGQPVNAAGEMCVRGAMAHAAGLDLFGVTIWAPRHTTLSAAFRCLETYLAEHPHLIAAETCTAHAERVERGYFPSWIWNDTTHGPEGDALVIDTLRRCAKSVRNSQGGCPSDPQATDGSVAA